MRCYLVDNAHDGAKVVKTFCGTQADVSALKKAAMAAGAKRKDLTISEVDVPDDKAGKIAYLNKCLNGEV